jgi:O-methyltransferase domain
MSEAASVWELLRGGLAVRALGLAADLELADALAAGPRAVDDLARETGADADVLWRLLRALASDGVFAEETGGTFRNTPASELLRAGSGWGDFAQLFGGVWLRAIADLDASGEASFPRTFGTDFWRWLAEHPVERAAFDRAMTQGWEGRVERLLGLGWREGELVVDVGGGNGSLLVELFRRQPGVRGIVFDLPETNRDEEALQAAGIEFVPGSFFDSVPEGDTYVLATILHDWDDESAAAILRTIAQHAPSGARVLVLDSVVASGNEPDGAKWLDLLMLTLFAGRERDEQQWRALLEEAGFEPVRLQDGLIEARCR